MCLNLASNHDRLMQISSWVDRKGDYLHGTVYIEAFQPFEMQVTASSLFGDVALQISVALVLGGNVTVKASHWNYIFRRGLSTAVLDDVLRIVRTLAGDLTVVALPTWFDEFILATFYTGHMIDFRQPLLTPICSLLLRNVTAYCLIR